MPKRRDSQGRQIFVIKLTANLRGTKEEIRCFFGFIYKQAWINKAVCWWAMKRHDVNLTDRTVEFNLLVLTF